MRHKRAHSARTSARRDRWFYMSAARFGRASRGSPRAEGKERRGFLPSASWSAAGWKPLTRMGARSKPASPSRPSRRRRVRTARLGANCKKNLNVSANSTGETLHLIVNEELSAVDSVSSDNRERSLADTATLHLRRMTTTVRWRSLGGLRTTGAPRSDKSSGTAFEVSINYSECRALPEWEAASRPRPKSFSTRAASRCASAARGQER